MPAKSALQFINYDVIQLSYKRTSEQLGTGELQITPQFHKSIKEVETDVFDVCLGVLIRGTEEHPLPFELCVDIVGHFTVSLNDGESDDIRRQLINQNSIAILFPFLRSTVASATLASNISPIILPLINLAKLFEEQEKKN